MSGYALDNADPVAALHHDILAELLDAHTRARIKALVSAATRHCLEIGAGGGSICWWLVQCGYQVTAVDADVRLLRRIPQLHTVECDLSAPGALAAALHGGPGAGGGFDLVLARMTLLHLPNRRRLLGELVSLLAPGGVLLVEDWAMLPAAQRLVAAPSPGAGDLFTRVTGALAAVFTGAGADPMWATTVAEAMRQEGLTDVATVTHQGDWRGGSPGMRLSVLTTRQLRPRLLAHGLSERELDTYAELAADPALVVRGHPMYSVSGHTGP